MENENLIYMSASVVGPFTICWSSYLLRETGHCHVIQFVSLHTKDMKRRPMDGGNNAPRGLLPSAYCFIFLQLPLLHTNKL